MMMSSSRYGLALALALAAGCSSSTSGTGASGSGGATSGASPTCADLGGACSKLGVSAKCASGTALVAEASSLCSATTPDCCVPPPPAGTVQRVNGSGLVCTTAGDFPVLTGTCGGQACQLGCECRASGCDCTRGLPPSSTGQELCAVFSCGVITCASGCSCADAAQSACTCP